MYNAQVVFSIERNQQSTLYTFAGVSVIVSTLCMMQTASPSAISAAS